MTGETATLSTAPRRARLPWRAVAAMALSVSPTLVFLWLQANAPFNAQLNVPVEHFVIATNVSVVAMLLGILVARSALQLGEFRSLLLALGFVCMAGIFAVHGLATPGVLLIGVKFLEAPLVVGVSASLALLVPAVFFAVRYTRLAPWLAARVSWSAFTFAVCLALALYAVLGLGTPGWFEGIARLLLVGTTDSSGYGVEVSSGSPLPYAAAGLTFALFGFAAWRQGVEFLRSRLPLQGALALSYVLLAQAQISQFFATVWTLAWWEYHGLMLAAVVIAVGAIFVELDRRRGLERFLPPTLVERVIAGDHIQLSGERRVATILFADLRGSTALADRLAPESTVAVLNTYLRLMARAVLDRGGVLDKFLGDGLMAIFLSMDNDPSDGAIAASACAREIRRAVSELNAMRDRSGEPTARFGVGMHTGDVVLGAIGLPERSDYTALGDTVNTAARMEALCKDFGVDVVLSADTAARLPPASLQRLGEATVRGKAETIEVSTLN